jgi:demethylspheroidene O-methyltransferase
MRHLDLSHAELTHGERSQWQDALAAWFDQLLTRPGLYRWALTNPVTRWFTQYRTRQVFNLMAGFVHTQVLLGCVRLKLLEQVRQSPKTLAELAAASGVPAAGLQRLIQSAVSLGLMEHRRQLRFGLGPLGAPVVSHPGIAAMIEHNQLLYQDMVDPVAILQDGWSGAMSDYWPYAHQAPMHAAERYSELMSTSQTFVIEEILSSFQFNGYRSVLDVGGGRGRFASALVQRHPQLQVALFDLPEVCAVTVRYLAQERVSDRIRVVPGDFTRGVLPHGADLVTLVRVAHDHCDAVVSALLRNIWEALPAGGALLLAEPMASTRGEQPQGDAYFHFYLLAMGSGRLRTPLELMQLMQGAGFTHMEVLPNAMPVHTRILLGRKSKCLP